MLELEKRNLHRNRLKSQTGTQVTLDDDFIVPDTMDDISERSWIPIDPVCGAGEGAEERITVRGKLEIHVLYRRKKADSDTGRSNPFEEGINVPELEEKGLCQCGLAAG